ncbi:MAG: hypothetical protein WCC01_09810 [Acidimicrobiia bacterium]
MGRTLSWISGAVIAVFLFAACSGGVIGPVVEGDRRTGGSDAEVFGTLRVEGDCAYLIWTETETRYPVIWPHGTGWDSEALVVVLPNGTLVHQGDEVYGGGGYHSSDLGGFTSQEGVDLVLSCVDNQYGEVAVFNSSSDIDVRN